MKDTTPINRSKGEFKDLISKIALPDSPVGIDAQYTHAIIITYLQSLSERLERIEKSLTKKE